MDGQRKWDFKYYFPSQGETQVPMCLWKETAVEMNLQNGTQVQGSHLKATSSRLPSAAAHHPSLLELK